MSSKISQTLSCVVMLTMIMSYPLLLIAGGRALDSMKNTPILWIPETSDGMRAFHDFVARFEALEVVLVSWDGATVDDDRLKLLADELRAKRCGQSEPKHYSDVVDGYSLCRDMMGPPLRLTRPAVLRRLQNFLVGPDGLTSCVAVVLTFHGAKQRDETMKLITDAARDVLNLEPNELRLAGPTVDGIAIDRLSRQSLQFFAVPSVAVSFFLCWFFLRSFWFTVPVVLIASYGQALCLSLVYLTGSQMNAVLIVLPALVFVLTISAGIHLVNYFMEEIRLGRRGDAVSLAIRRAWVPSLLAALTTAIGLSSLLVSNIEPVRQFGWFGATAIITCFGLLFLVFPGVMYRWQSRWHGDQKFYSFIAVAPDPMPTFWYRVAEIISGRHLVISLLGGALLVGMGWGMRYTKTTVDITALLDENVPEVRDSAWFQENIGPLIPVEIIVRFPTGCEVDVVERVKLVSQIHATLNHLEPISGTISVATFVPSVSGRGDVRSVIGRSMLRNRIESEEGALVRAGYLREDVDGQHWRISSRADSRPDVDFAALLLTIRRQVEPLVENFEIANDVQLGTTFTGVTSAVHEVQRLLLIDLFKSFFVAVALVTLVMIIAFRSVGAALLAMVPNVFPTFVMFGALGWLGKAIDIGSVMTASVALGIAVDGTFHFLCSYRSAIASGQMSRQAVAHSFQHCARAILQTTVVCTLGILVYCFSSFLPARNFAFTFMLLLFLASAGDLVLLPALLLGWAGRLFTTRSISGGGI